MNWFDMEILLAVTREKSMRKAAKRLNLSQASISKRIQVIEDEYSIQLFTRTASGVELTESGQMFVTYASKALHIFNEGIRQAKRLDKADRTILLGVTSPLITLVHSLAPYFSTHYPDKKLETVTLDSITIIERLKEGMLHFGMFSYPTSPEGIQHVLLFKQRFCLIGTPEFLAPLKRLEGLTISFAKPVLLQALRTTPLVAPKQGFGLRIMINDMYRKELKSDPRIIMESDTKDIILHLVRKGVGCTILSDIESRAVEPSLDTKAGSALIYIEEDPDSNVYRIPISFLFPPRHVYFASSNHNLGFSAEQLSHIFKYE